MAQQMIQLLITMDPSDGKVSVTGPIDQPVLAYGLLELARDAIKDHNARRTEEAQRRIVPPGPADLAIVNGGKRH